MRRCSLIACVFAFLVGPLSAQDLDYALTDRDLKLVRLDSDPTESFLSLRVDALGRIFVGGREKLFVYEPDDKGGYLPRRVLAMFPKHTWIYDVEYRGNDLYVLTTTALYFLRDGMTRRDGLKPEKWIWGVPLGHVHQCFHALAWGPEGDLYISVGDPLWYYGDFDRPDHWGHWTFFCRPDGTKVPYTGVGGVLRCKPDGSNLRVVARGMRNSCGLAFDRDWNLFSNDNDHESLPAAYVPGRLLHVTPHADFAWPRGWMPSKTPERADLLDTMFDGMGRAVPVGQAYYGDSYLPKKYHGNLLVARWCTRTLACYPLERRGASFHAREERPLLVGKGNARPVGVTVGRDGRLFVTICYMAHNEASPIYRSDLVMITRKDDAQKFEELDLKDATVDRLFQELGHDDWSHRMRAHVEVLRRGRDLTKDINDRLNSAKADDPALPHLLWLSASTGKANLNLTGRLADPDARARLHALRALAEFPEQLRGVPVLTRRLDDADLHVRLAAVLAHFDPRVHCGEAALTMALDLAGRHDDTYLRQAAAYLWAERAELRRIVELQEEENARTRLLGVLAAGFRLTIPLADKAIPDGLPLAPFRTKEATLIEYADGVVDLAKHGRVGAFSVAEHWKAGKHGKEQETLFGLLDKCLEDKDEAVRLQAAHFLYLLDDPRSEKRVAKVRAASVEKQLATAPLTVIKPLWVAGPFPDGKKLVDGLERGPTNLAAQFEVDGKKIGWQTIEPDYRYDLGKLPGAADNASYYAYTRLESAGREKVHLLVGSDGGLRVWHNAKLVFTRDGTRAALPFQDVVPLELEPGGNEILVRMHHASGDPVLYLHFRARGSVAARLPDKLDSATLADRLKAVGKEAVIAKEFLTVDWDKEARRGDAEKGRKLFETLACSKCHGVSAAAGNLGGPSLAGAGKRFTVSYLVESILAPSKQVSPVFQTTQLETRAGKIVQGLVMQETAAEVVLLQLDATRLTLAKKDIETRRTIATSPMPGGLVRTVDELRDLLSYLLDEKRLGP